MSMAQYTEFILKENRNLLVRFSLVFITVIHVPSFKLDIFWGIGLHG
jgi:hypothetical protein